MGPKPRDAGADVNLFRMELFSLIDRRHELVKLSGPTANCSAVANPEHFGMSDRNTVDTGHSSSPASEITGLGISRP